MYTVHVLGIDGVWREYHVFASRAAAERSVIGFEAEGFRAKVYRTASGPIEEDVKDNHHRRNLGKRAFQAIVSRLGFSAASDAAG